MKSGSGITFGEFLRRHAVNRSARGPALSEADTPSVAYVADLPSSTYVALRTCSVQPVLAMEYLHGLRA